MMLAGKTMNTANGRFEKIPREFQDILLFAVSRDNKCVGVRLFSNNERLQSERLENYVEESVKRAVELKLSIEGGLCDIERNREIILRPSTKFTNSASLNQSRSRSKGIEQIQIDGENRFIDLGKVLIQSAQTGKVELLKCEICLGELYVLSKHLLTPLMLKKNPEIVHAVLKLCRYVDVNIPSCSKIRSFANKTSSGFKTVMGFKNGTNDAFQQWFNESVVLFRELTSNITADERRQLLDDPESTLTDHIVA